MPTKPTPKPPNKQKGIEQYPKITQTSFIRLHNRYDSYTDIELNDKVKNIEDCLKLVKCLATQYKYYTYFEKYKTATDELTCYSESFNFSRPFYI